MQSCAGPALTTKITKSRSGEYLFLTKSHRDFIDMANMARLALVSTFLLLLVPASAADASQHVMSASRSSRGTVSDVHDEYGWRPANRTAMELTVVADWSKPRSSPPSLTTLSHHCSSKPPGQPATKPSSATRSSPRISRMPPLSSLPTQLTARPRRRVWSLPSPTRMRHPGTTPNGPSSATGSQQPRPRRSVPRANRCSSRPSPT